MSEVPNFLKSWASSAFRKNMTETRNYLLSAEAASRAFVEGQEIYPEIAEQISKFRSALAEALKAADVLDDAVDSLPPPWSR